MGETPFFEEEQEAAAERPTWSVAPAGEGSMLGLGERGVWHVCQQRSWELRAEPPPCPFERARWRDLPWVRANHPGYDLDGWGNPLLMTCTLVSGHWRVAVASAGRDGKLDTADDVVVPCRAMEYPGMQ